MTDWIQDTLFGAAARLVTGGRLFGWQDERDESRRKDLLYGKRKHPINEPDGGLDSPTPRSHSPDRAEKGEKALLIDWLDNDTHVGWDAFPKTPHS